MSYTYDPQTVQALHDERRMLHAALEDAKCLLARVPQVSSQISHVPKLLMDCAEFQRRWDAYWAELDRAAADLPPSMRID